jgi:apolipoprotein N-acyltransferase
MIDEEQIKDCIDVVGYRICGVRTFIIALVILIPFSVLAFQTQATDLLFAAATMILSFFFGMKNEQKNEEIANLKSQLKEKLQTDLLVASIPQPLEYKVEGGEKEDGSNNQG